VVEHCVGTIGGRRCYECLKLGVARYIPTCPAITIPIISIIPGVLFQVAAELLITLIENAELPEDRYYEITELLEFSHAVELWESYMNADLETAEAFEHWKTDFMKIII
jgi:hypothetical protein